VLENKGNVALIFLPLFFCPYFLGMPGGRIEQPLKEDVLKA
jgi:hypothetical protein